jgi:hypothetical protein
MHRKMHRKRLFVTVSQEAIDTIWAEGVSYT